MFVASWEEDEDEDEDEDEEEEAMLHKTKFSKRSRCPSTLTIQGLNKKYFFFLRICAWEAMLHKLAALKFVRSLLSNSSTMAPNMPV
jgi:hypothetical protein